MEIQGKVTAILPEKEGIGKTGNAWRTQEFVMETKEQYPKKCCLQVMNENIDRFDVNARQWEGRYFNTLTAWEVVVLNPQDFPAKQVKE